MALIIMKKKVLSIFFALVIACVPLTQPGIAHAAPSCMSDNIDFVGSPPPSEITSPSYSFSFTVEGLDANTMYTLSRLSTSTNLQSVASVQSNNDGKASFTVSNALAFPSENDPNAPEYTKYTYYSFLLSGPGIGNWTSDYCDLWEYKLTDSLTCTANSIRIFQERGGKRCYYQEGTSGSCLDTKSQIMFAGTDIYRFAGPYNGTIQLNVTQNATSIGQHNLTAVNGTTNVVGLTFPEGTYTAYLEKPGSPLNLCSNPFFVSPECDPTLCLDSVDAAPGSLGPDKFNLCEQVKDPTAQQKCMQCAGGADGQEGIWTAVGCIKRQPEEIVSRFIRLGVSMGGGVALLMILAAGFTLTISQGNAQKTAQAKEMITAAVTGLLFIIFSITILQFIGFSILKIPGFGG